MLIGLNSGDGKLLSYLHLDFFGEKKNHCLIYCILFFPYVVYSVSLRQQLQDVGKKLVGAQHYNKDGSVSSRQDFYFLLSVGLYSP